MYTQIALASLATFTTCTADMKTPEYWGDFFLNKYAAERAAAMDLEPGHTPLAQPRTVLLITGVTIPAVWFDPIKARLERDGFRPVVWEPPALLSGDLFENSERLADVVDDIRAQTGEDKIDILAECTGGLVARHYIQSLGGDEHVSRLVTFISPQGGIPKAAEAALFADWDALQDLTPGSDFLQAVHGAPLPDNVPVTSIYTCSDEYIQPYSTSIIPGAKNIGLCDEFVGHFQFFYDPAIYDLMHAELTAPLPASDADPQDDAAPQDDDTVDEPTPEASGCSTTGSSSAGLVVLAAIAVGFRRRRRATPAAADAQGS